MNNFASKKRNLNIDLIRGFAILTIIIYHIYCVTNIRFKHEIFNSLISLGGELGVTIFFILSGYSIYMLLSNNKKITYREYIFGRLKKLLPHYYLSIFIVLLFTTSAVYLSNSGFLSIFSHTFLFHNLFYNTHGSINGVCWTLGVIFQFYLLAPLIKKWLDKRPIITTIISILITLFIKYILFLFVFPKNNVDSMYYFMYGRQLFTASEIFIFGMLIAKYSKPSEKKFNILTLIKYIISLACLTLILLYGANYKIKVPIEIYSANVKGVYYSVLLALSCAINIYYFSKLKISNNFITNCILFVSKHEYAIYIWHLLILTNLISISEYVRKILNYNSIIVYSILSILIIFICVAIDLIVSSIDLDMLKSKLAKYSKQILNLLLIVMFVFIIPKIFSLCTTIKNFKIQCDVACEIENNYYNKMDCTDGVCNYLILDNPTDGFLNYYKLRYTLAPHIPYDFNENFIVLNELNDKTDNDFYEYIMSLDCDYVIAISSDVLEKYNYDISNNKLYTVNKYSTYIDDMLVEVK